MRRFVLSMLVGSTPAVLAAGQACADPIRLDVTFTKRMLAVNDPYGGFGGNFPDQTVQDGTFAPVIFQIEIDPNTTRTTIDPVRQWDQQTGFSGPSGTTQWVQTRVTYGYTSFAASAISSTPFTDGLRALDTLGASWVWESYSRGSIYSVYSEYANSSYPSGGVSNASVGEGYDSNVFSIDSTEQNYTYGFNLGFEGTKPISSGGISNTPEAFLDILQHPVSINVQEYAWFRTTDYNTGITTWTGAEYDGVAQIAAVAQPPGVAVPEPTALTLLGTGLLGLGLVRRRKRT